MNALECRRRLDARTEPNQDDLGSGNRSVLRIRQRQRKDARGDESPRPHFEALSRRRTRRDSDVLASPSCEFCYENE